MVIRTWKRDGSTNRFAKLDDAVENLLGNSIDAEVLAKAAKASRRQLIRGLLMEGKTLHTRLAEFRLEVSAVGARA